MLTIYVGTWGDSPKAFSTIKVELLRLQSLVEKMKRKIFLAKKN
jgi:hypothetical protein